MEEKDYEALVDMFASDGWKLYIQDIEYVENTLTTTAVDGADSNDKWQYTRGRIHQLRATLGYQQSIEAAWREKDSIEEEFSPNVDVI